MGVYKEGKNWKVQVYYKDWQGNRKRKQKRGFRTKGEAKEWERDFLQQQSQGVDIEFGNFLEIYYKDMDVRLRENTMYTKRYIIDLKIKPYFEKKILSEITVADVRAWQNELLTYKDKNGKGYSPTYLKTVNCQLTAIFNYAMRYYNLQDNPCRKAGAIGKSKGEPKDFWMQEEFNAFLETVSDKPETRMAFLLLYWTGMRIGELLALTYNDINLEEKTISINKSYQRLKGKDMITQPKTPKSIRVITMPDFLAEEFREYCSHLYGIMKKERLFRFTKSHMEHCMATGIERSGLEQLIRTIGKVRRQLNKQLKIGGILITMVDNRTNYARDISDLIFDTYGNQIKIFPQSIPFSVRAAEISAEGISIFEHDPKGKVAAAYWQMTQEVLLDER